MGLIQSNSLALFAVFGLWTVWNTERVNSFMLRDLKVCKKTNRKLAMLGKQLGEVR